MRAKFIYEKFVEDSDPIADMGIGLMPEIKKWAESQSSYGSEQDILWLCADNEKVDYIRYLLKTHIKRHVHAWKELALRYAILRGNIEIIKLLLDAGADPTARDNESIRMAEDYITRYKDTNYKKILRMLKKHVDKTKLKESLNEKFTEESDPIHDMGIGIFSVHNFEKEKDAIAFMLKAIPAILKTDKIPNDIVYPNGHDYLFNWSYFSRIHSYIDTYIKVEENEGFDVQYNLGMKLRKMGYPKQVNEKFIEDSDPVHDLGIGLQAACEIWKKELGKHCAASFNKEFLPEIKDSAKNENIGITVYTTIKWISEKMPIQEAFDDACEAHGYKDERYKEQRMIAANILKKHFGIIVKV